MKYTNKYDFCDLKLNVRRSAFEMLYRLLYKDRTVDYYGKFKAYIFKNLLSLKNVQRVGDIFRADENQWGPAARGLSAFIMSLPMGAVFDEKRNEIKPIYPETVPFTNIEFFMNNAMSVPECREPKFDRSHYLIDTNLTAQDWISLTELVKMIEGAADDTERTEYLRRLCGVLFNIDWKHPLILRRDIGTMFGMYLWVRGIINFVMLESQYYMLFRPQPTTIVGRDGQTKLAPKAKAYSSANDVIFELEKAGYKDVKQMPLEEFFDAQFHLLNSQIRKALREKVKPIDIAQRTGLTVAYIESLRE